MHIPTHDSTPSSRQATESSAAPHANGAAGANGDANDRETVTALRPALNPLWVINIGMGIFFCMAAALLAKG